MPLALDDFFGDRLISDLTAPPIDVTESDSAYIVTAELPGVKLEDLTVEFEGSVLTLHGEKRDQRQESLDRGRVLERVYGAFSRSLRLPEDADPEQVSASFQNGVLRIEVAKRPEARPRPVQIHG